MSEIINPLDLTGKIAFITGGSRGIGAAIARALDRHGVRCIVNYVADSTGQNRSDAEAVAASLKNAGLVECDVSQPSRVDAMMFAIQKDYGGLDILINNAGILRDQSIRKMSHFDWNAVLQVNLGGPFNCIRAALQLLRDGGRIVNLASVSALTGFFGQANYASSKAGVIALTKVAARELAKRKITVNAVAPGFIQTDMTRTMPEDVAKSFIQQIPLGRMGSAEDVAGAVLFLCSPLADYVTGQVLHVNGGFLMP